MKTWNMPIVEELDVKLTADGGVRSTNEAAGYLDNGWNDSTYDESVYEKLSDDATCVVKSEQCMES